MISNGNKNIDIIDLSIDDDENDRIIADEVTNDVTKNYDIIKKRFSSKLPFEISDIPKNKLKDSYCWICHLNANVFSCKDCLRSYHLKCLCLTDQPNPEEWTCEECERLQLAQKEKRVFSKVKSDQFYLMLENALKRLKYPGSEPFQKPVDLMQFKEYRKYVIYPVDISLMDDKIKAHEYVCLEEFLADAKWMFHNSCVYNGVQNKLSSTAKSILRMIKHEINEMEVCSDCYLNSILKFEDNWFCEPCRVPHPLIWAKMKGFPFWPAKALRIVNGEIDVRFFGAHDRSWIEASKCFWLSRNTPNSARQRLNCNIEPSLIELNLHIERLTQRFGEFVYAPYRESVDPEKPFNFLPNQTFLPIITENSKNARQIHKQRTNSGDGDSLCSSKANETSLDNPSNSNELSVATEAAPKLHWKQKRKLKLLKNKTLSKSFSNENRRDFEKPETTKRHRTESSDKIKLTQTASKFSLSSISPNSTSSSINSSDTMISKMVISVSTRDGTEMSDDSLEHSFKRKISNTNNNTQEDDPFEPTCLDMSSQENSNILKTLFLEKSLVDTNGVKEEKNNENNNADIEKVVKKCKASLGIEKVDLLSQCNEFLSNLKEIKNESSTNDEISKMSKQEIFDFKREITKDSKKKINEFKKLIEEKNKKEIDNIKQDYDRLIKEMQFNSEMKIKEVIAECTKEKLKAQKLNEKLIEETKRKQWCSNCYKEAIYYCCWNTSYCDENCQRLNWTTHMNNCLRGKIILDTSPSNGQAGNTQDSLME